MVKEESISPLDAPFVKALVRGPSKARVAGDLRDLRCRLSEIRLMLNGNEDEDALQAARAAQEAEDLTFLLERRVEAKRDRSET